MRRGGRRATRVAVFLGRSRNSSRDSEKTQSEDRAFTGPILDWRMDRHEVNPRRGSSTDFYEPPDAYNAQNIVQGAVAPENSGCFVGPRKAAPRLDSFCNVVDRRVTIRRIGGDRSVHIRRRAFDADLGSYIHTACAAASYEARSSRRSPALAERDDTGGIDAVDAAADAHRPPARRRRAEAHPSVRGHRQSGPRELCRKGPVCHGRLLAPGSVWAMDAYASRIPHHLCARTVLRAPPPPN